MTGRRTNKSGILWHTCCGCAR